MRKNVVQERSLELAVEIVFLYKYLTSEKREFVISKQVLRSGTSVGANIAEGVVAPSKKEFCHRLSIAYKEARETQYWLKILGITGYLPDEKSATARHKCDEVIKLLYAILRSASVNEGS